MRSVSLATSQDMRLAGRISFNKLLPEGPYLSLPRHAPLVARHQPQLFPGIRTPRGSRISIETTGVVSSFCPYVGGVVTPQFPSRSLCSEKRALARTSLVGGAGCQRLYELTIVTPRSLTKTLLMLQ
ncbi:hypothetical protein NDU88_004281 [Pleurodeles waltl]|uniref:Uncharacterized protein n=1 Tax=Pleurodeles waltl TaxID=8319 RepID=A0AAV7WRV2_PLEWA|nr:hypothetical protein NDU88_004281 [Pleurodeles waltl]